MSIILNNIHKVNKNETYVTIIIPSNVGWWYNNKKEQSKAIQRRKGGI